MYVFEKQTTAVGEERAPTDEEMMRRIGWAHRLLPPGSEALHEFPSRLVQRVVKVGFEPQF